MKPDAAMEVGMDAFQDMGKIAWENAVSVLTKFSRRATLVV